MVLLAITGLTVTAAEEELSIGHTPLCTPARNCVDCVRVPVLKGFDVETMSVQLVPASVDFCHFLITPICPLRLIVVEEPLQMDEEPAVAVPPTLAAFTITVLVQVLLQPLALVIVELSVNEPWTPAST